MKNIKVFTACLMSLLLVFSIPTSAFASNQINNNVDDKVVHQKLIQENYDYAVPSQDYNIYGGRQPKVF